MLQPLQLFHNEIFTTKNMNFEVQAKDVKISLTCIFINIKKLLQKLIDNFINKGIYGSFYNSLEMFGP